MPRIFVMSYDEDDLTEEAKKEINGKLEAFLKEHTDVKFNGLWVSNDGVGICDWEAPDIEAVEKAVDAVGLPYDEIIELEKVML